MIGYQLVGTNDLDKAVAFYDELLAVIGGKRAMETPNGQAYGFASGPMFGVTRPYDSGTASFGNGTMTAFNAGTEDKVQEIYAKALELGGQSEGEPGERGGFGCFAYFRDLDGNKLCAFCMNG